MDAEKLFQTFYGSLAIPLRSVFEYKMRRRGVSPLEVLEKPWLLLRYVEQEMGRHTAELVNMLFVDFAKSRGVDPRAAAEALQGPEGWRRLVEYLRSPRSWM
jgi:hypothetical protein